MSGRESLQEAVKQGTGPGVNGGVVSGALCMYIWQSLTEQILLEREPYRKEDRPFRLATCE